MHAELVVCIAYSISVFGLPGPPVGTSRCRGGCGLYILLVQDRRKMNPGPLCILLLVVFQLLYFHGSRN